VELATMRTEDIARGELPHHDRVFPSRQEKRA
jgi:hypothetical protein